VRSAETLTLSDALLRRSSLALDLSLIAGFAGLTALAAQIRLPLPFTPVPVTGQTFAALFCGAALGSRRGAAAQMLYLAAGCAGLPVYAGGGSGLPLMPSGGYLLGFIAAAYLVGKLVERGWDRRVRTAALAMALGNGVIYLFGLPWLALYVRGGPAAVVGQGLLPFIPGDLLKLALAAAGLPSAWALVRRASR
jgi:biotin transport system substrate-specific component